jgi:hypothetical protein
MTLHRLPACACRSIFLKLDVAVVISDVDVLWLRNPIPYFQRYPEADILTSSDNMAATVGPSRVGHGATVGPSSSSQQCNPLDWGDVGTQAGRRPCVGHARRALMWVTRAPVPQVKDESLELWPNAGSAANIGIMLFRCAVAEHTADAAAAGLSPRGSDRA